MNGYIPRRLGDTIRKVSGQYPAVAIVGPRQSGKTTLARNLFPEYAYYSLESLDHRHRAEHDPRQFLRDVGPRVVLDEIQRVPLLFSYLQEYVDDPHSHRHYILTGSHQFLLMEQITQSLAGRIVTFQLYPLTVDELFPPPQRQADLEATATSELLLGGFYPRIHNQHLDPTTWYEGYLHTYIERDVRQILNVADIRQFETFLRIVAGHSGQILNKAAIANRIGVSEPTVTRWISVLETSGILCIVPPYYRNLKKRLIKSPKIYLLDSGLLCFLLGIYSPHQVITHPLYGSIFESFIVAEIYKRISHRGSRAQCYFWRDQTGHEIDLLIEDGLRLTPLEIKSSATWHTDFAKSLNWWMDLPGNETKEGLIIYDGTAEVQTGGRIPGIPWRKLDLFS